MGWIRRHGPVAISGFDFKQGVARVLCTLAELSPVLPSFKAPILSGVGVGLSEKSRLPGLWTTWSTSPLDVIVFGEAFAPVLRRNLPSSHLAGIGFDLTLTFLAPKDQPDAGGGGMTERHRWAGLGFHANFGKEKVLT